MGSKPVEYLIEASSGAHFSGFHMDGMQARNLQEGQATTSVTENMQKQPFIIGMYGSKNTSILHLITHIVSVEPRCLAIRLLCIVSS